MDEIELKKILTKIENSESRSKKRAVIFVLIPITVAIVLITFTTQKIIKAQNELNKIDRTIRDYKAKEKQYQIKLNKSILLNKSLRLQNDSLTNSLVESTLTLGRAVSVTTEFKKFIDKEKPYLRSQDEASFFINFRMMEDKIRGNYAALSKKISTLPNLDEGQQWIVIVQTSASLEDLKKESPSLILKFGKEGVGIYQASKGNYVLAVKGNGTFTRAYRLNVELRDKYGYEGAYFSPSPNWGNNYL